MFWERDKIKKGIVPKKMYLQKAVIRKHIFKLPRRMKYAEYFSTILNLIHRPLNNFKFR